MIPSENPQNPYKSFIVRASAGCGKTYQLSRRFLFLVGAGANPFHILTITFTKKAAAEMRERILSSAAELLKKPESARIFEDELKVFYQHFKRDHQQTIEVAPPRTARQTAKAILSGTQLLKIATIDSVFMDWVRKFPWEAKAEGHHFPARFDLISERQERELNEAAWALTCRDLFEDSQPIEDNPLYQLNPFEIKNRLTGLLKNRSFLWLVEAQQHIQSPTSASEGQHKNQEPTAYLAHNHSTDETEDYSEKDFIQKCRRELIAIANQTKPEKACILLEAIEALDWESLIEQKLLKKDWQVHGGTIRGKKKELVQSEIDFINEFAQNIFNQKKIKRLNRIGQSLFDLYKDFAKNRDQIKMQNSHVEFDDLAQGGYRLFSEDCALGARFLIHRTTEHLLLDEFQDTSMLQWSIFGQIAAEFFSGLGLENSAQLPPSVFIVGDKKQAIYGFREADAKILDIASDYLQNFDVSEVQLNYSFRTSQIILDFVGQTFQQIGMTIPHHQTAREENTSSPVIPNMGTVGIAHLFDEKHVSGDLECMEAEAEFVAKYIKAMVEGENKQHVFDKNTKKFRDLKYKDCVILYRSATHAGHFEAALRKLGIETKREEARGFFQRQEIQDIKSLLSFFSYPQDTMSLLAFLKSPLASIPDSQILSLLIKSQHLKHAPLERNLFIIESLKKDGCKTADFLWKTKNICHHLSPFSLIELIINEIDAIAVFGSLYGGSEGRLAAANLKHFRELSLQIELSGINNLSQFIKELAVLEDDDEDGLASEVTEAVTLMTIHKSKGLEFPFVALVGTGEAWEKSDPYWVKFSSEGTKGIYYVGRKDDHPQNDPRFDHIIRQADDEAREENMRLLYVALTRAKHHLLITGSKPPQSKKQDGYFANLEKALATWQDVKSKKLGHYSYSLATATCERTLILQPDDAQQSASQTGKPWQNSDLSPHEHFASSRCLGEIKTLAPARLLSERPAALGAKRSLQKQSRFAPFEQEFGNFIHKVLECDIKNTPIRYEQCWTELYSAKAKIETFMNLMPWAIQEAHALLNHPSWKNIKNLGGNARTEQDIVCYDGDQLIRGTIDLLIEVSSLEIWIIDHKTIEEAKVTSNLELLTQEHGYDKQLALYQKATQGIYPQAKINVAVYYTSARKMHLVHRNF